MEDRIRRLEEKLDEVARSVQSLQTRVAAIEGAPPPSEQPVEHAIADQPRADVPPQPTTPRISVSTTLTMVGRVFLVLAGAFLLRAMTDAGVVPPLLGVLLGLTYAAIWIVLADRTGPPTGSFYGFSAALVTYPLVWEATTKLDVLTPGVGAAALAVLSGLGLLVAWHRRIRLLAWVFSLAAAVTAFALYVTTGALEIFTGFLILLGIATVWLAYSRRWWGPQWVVALAADAAVLVLVLRTARPQGPAAGISSADAVQVLAMSLLVGYLGSFAIRTLARRREVTVFEIVQSAGALLVGFGGAVRVAHVSETGVVGLGVAALITGAACYAVAFAFVRRRLGRGRNFFFYTSLALVFTFLGSALLASGGSLALIFGALAIATGYIGGHFDRVTLRYHSAVYATAAALQSGLVLSSSEAFSVRSDQTPLIPGATGLIVLGLTLVGYVVIAGFQRRNSDTPARRIPGLVLAALSALGVAGLVVAFAAPLVTDDGGTIDPAGIALTRTAVLAGAAIVLGVVARLLTFTELGWLVYPLLVVGAIKLVIEDLRHGQPLYLFLGFVCFGLALIVTARLRRRDSARAAPPKS